LGFFEQLQQKAQELGIRDRVKFVDRLAEAQLPALYAATDIVINFPQFDSFTAHSHAPASSSVTGKLSNCGKLMTISVAAYKAGSCASASRSTNFTRSRIPS